MFEFLIFILAFLCPDPTHTPETNCPGFHIIMDSTGDTDTETDDDTGGETGTVPPNPPPPPPPPPRP